MPLYGDLKFKDTLTYVTNFSVPVGWRSQYCGLFKAERDGVVFYFIDNEYYFKRSGLYGFYDDGERFAFFSRAILEMLFYTDFEPDIINCNDWQTALTPVYLNLYYRIWISSAASRQCSRSTTLPTRASMVWIFSRIPAASAHVTPMLWSMTAVPTS